MEPVIIATHRQLSPLHPVHQALVHHFKDTLDINAAARKALVNAGGIIEKTFTPHEISMQMSSTWYKHKWRFDEQALPVDLLKRYYLPFYLPSSKHHIHILGQIVLKLKVTNNVLECA